jgi:hypothetical protein
LIPGQNTVYQHLPKYKVPMKNKFLFSFRSQFGALGVFLGLAFLFCASLNAQDLLKNGSFENPIDPEGSSGTTNWTVVYAYGGPADFAYADRTTEACKSSHVGFADGGSWGAAFRPNHCEYMHAYHKQIVTGLTNGASYTLSGYMHTGYTANGKNHVYIQMYGGSDGTTLVTIPEATTSRTQYFLTNTASTGGQIEVRVGLRIQPEIPAWGDEDPKFVKCEGWFDLFESTKNP